MQYSLVDHRVRYNLKSLKNVLYTRHICRASSMEKNCRHTNRALRAKQLQELFSTLTASVRYRRDFSLDILTSYHLISSLFNV